MQYRPRDSSNDVNMLDSAKQETGDIVRNGHAVGIASGRQAKELFSDLII